MENSWIAAQMLKNVEQWDRSLTTYYPETLAWMSNPLSYLTRLTVDCNYLNAAKLVAWSKYLPNDAVVLDVGCGGGWLTAFLSSKTQVKKVIAIDSSKNYLEHFLPAVVEKQSRDRSKVETIQGVFAPLLLASDSVDAIAISSALHHAESLGTVLNEFRRVLKPGCYLVILNETPAATLEYLNRIIKAFIKIILAIVSKKYTTHLTKISAGGFLYDPYLGDVDYPEWYWKKAIVASGFELIEVCNTGLATVVNAPGRTLKHFICRKRPS